LWFLASGFYWLRSDVCGDRLQSRAYFSVKGRHAMIISTTHAIEGRQITAYLDIVSAESVQGVNVIRDMFAGMRDFFGGRSQTLERALKEARVQATEELRERAKALQADAVVGVDFEISMPGGKGGMVVVFATGTAVKLR
jgi:uncharacterized protein YbjQ (UPF0145 family)